MRDYLLLHVNGMQHQVSGEHAFWTLSDFLRHSLGLVGTKIVCSEGDCGACSVLVGRLDANGHSLNYHAIDSCIAFLYQLDCTHIVSVEGLHRVTKDNQCSKNDERPSGDGQSLTAIQQAMVDCHGSQCGFCTPGFVTTMHAVFEECENSEPDEEALRLGLSGNLCRCTGYVQIIEAAQSVSATDVEPINELFPPSPICDALANSQNDPLLIQADKRTVFVPRAWEDAIRIKNDHPDTRPVNGATDVGVQHNHGQAPHAKLLCLSQVRELTEIQVDNEQLVIGAGATWTHLLEALAEPFPQTVEIFSRFGSPQIRNMGTIGGNLANASPIADCIPFLYAMEAVVLLESVEGIREVPIADFFLGYKKLDLRNNEMIRNIVIPKLTPNEQLLLDKVSRRRDMDISTFTAAMRMGIDGDRIASPTIALGGVGPTVLRVYDAENCLEGESLSLKAMQAAGKATRKSIQPISDVRGSDRYRWQLAENIFLKWFHELNEKFAVTS